MDVDRPLQRRLTRRARRTVRVTMSQGSSAGSPGEAICVVPGDCLCAADDKHVAGKGTIERSGYIYSCLVGRVYTQQQQDKTELVEVRTGQEQNIVPTAGSVVTAKVTYVNPRFLRCEILCIGETVLKHKFRGMLKKEDVRATERDKVKMYECFRPGDVILAKVVSLGDALSYVLSTAENELGVALAHSEAGALMVPLSWAEMRCPLTQARELRKVAKIPPEDVAFRLARSAAADPAAG
ncbi:exosome complex component CSL4-like isoform X1 [Amphibalanus amphitrite]|uniref:exosome complex component CSL4-like isoform X1 n=2 Tax=Amphibalanus amphitrite TaxID=1232801 RepID=UPI001C91AFC4|nr:exosome complex component CSL4-like isoform X1 [Amphibalanus amphitrite]